VRWVHEYAGDYEAALAIHQHDADTTGAARCLLALDRAAEALAITDDAELRAEALDRLGRTDEATQIREHIAWDKHA
jgi:hypothetical protein